MRRCLAAGWGQPTTAPLSALGNNFSEDGQEFSLTKVMCANGLQLNLLLTMWYQFGQ